MWRPTPAPAAYVSAALRLSVKSPTAQASTVGYGSLAISEGAGVSRGAKTYGRQARHLKYRCVITGNSTVRYLHAHIVTADIGIAVFWNNSQVCCVFFFSFS